MSDTNDRLEAARKNLWQAILASESCSFTPLSVCPRHRDPVLDAIAELEAAARAPLEAETAQLRAQVGAGAQLFEDFCALQGYDGEEEP